MTAANISQERIDATIRVALLAHESECAFFDAAEDSGFTFDSKCPIGQNIYLDIALDLLGFPSDNWSKEHTDALNNGVGPDVFKELFPDAFSREPQHAAWDTLRDNQLTGIDLAESYVRYVNDLLEEIWKLIL